MNFKFSKLNRLVYLLKKINIDLQFGSNFPYIYLTHINGEQVTETKNAEHGYCVGTWPWRTDQEFKFDDLNHLFVTIRKYVKRSKT